jgi:hypothetical protein
METENAIEINPTDTSIRWPMLHDLMSRSNSAYAGDASADALQYTPDKTADDQSSLLRSLTSFASISLSKASLLAPSSQSRPAIVRTTTSHSSLAAKSQLEELAAAADKQEDRLKLARHKSTG